MTADSGPVPASAAAAPVPHAVFSTAALDGGDAFAFWRDSISCIFEVEADADVRRDRFHAEIDANMFGPIMLARTQTRAQDWDRTARLMAQDGMDHYMVQLFEHGTMQWEGAGGTVRIPENGLVVFDLAREVRTATTDFANMSLIVPRDMLQDRLRAADDQHMRVLHGGEPMVNLLRDHMLSLKRLAPAMTAQQAVEIAPATASLAAACLNAALGDDPGIREGVGLAQLGRLRRFIEGHLSDPALSADWIARQAGVSRSKLYALFESYGGVASYVRERRLRRALLALTDRHGHARTIHEVAMAAGYANDTAFSRAFRARYGIAPNDIRQSGAPPATARAGDGIDRRYENWLRHLSV